MDKVIIKQIKKFIEDMSNLTKGKETEYTKGYRQSLIDIGLIIETGEEIDDARD